MLPKCYKKVPKSAEKFTFVRTVTKNIRAEKVSGVTRKNVALTITSSETDEYVFDEENDGRKHKFKR